MFDHKKANLLLENVFDFILENVDEYDFAMENKAQNNINEIRSLFWDCFSKNY